MRLPVVPGDLVKSNGHCSVDYSQCEDGYVVVSYLGEFEKKCVVQLKTAKGGQKFTISDPKMDARLMRYDYFQNIGGVQKVIPLCYGDGPYEMTIHRQIVDTRYSTLMTWKHDVKIPEPFSPWLFPNTYVSYGPDSLCVNLARNLRQDAPSDAIKVQRIFDWMCEHIIYDYPLAVKVSDTDKFWLPCPDEVIQTGKSICFGFSSLFAAINRINDIPCKVVVGWAGHAYHAWNEVYLQGVWQRYDVTFSAGKKQSVAIQNFIGDGNNYRIDYCG